MKSVVATSVVGLIRGEERYVIVFDDDQRTEAFRTLGRWAANPELAFDWTNAAVMSLRIRAMQGEKA